MIENQGAGKNARPLVVVFPRVMPSLLASIFPDCANSRIEIASLVETAPDEYKEANQERQDY